MREFIRIHPYWFVLIVFIVTLLIPLPFVAVYKFFSFDMEQLRLLIPFIESLFIICLLWRLGWLMKAGFGNRIKDLNLLWLPIILAFIPLAYFGSTTIAANSLLFYILAIFFTGVSEEGFARGLGLNALLPKGKWIAVLFLALIFGLSHITNFFFTTFVPMDALVRLFNLFTFAVLYGAVYLRVQNIWPLIISHTLWDISLIVSGSAGPFMVTPMPPYFEIIIGTISLVYAWFILKDVKTELLLKNFNE